MISFVAFSAFRGTMDLKSCVKISVLSNGLNMALTPVLIHVFRFGISGSALTSLVCDCLTALSYLRLMNDRKYLVPSKMFKLPSWEKVAPIVKGSALQVKSFALLFTNLLVTRKVQSLGDDGVAPAAFALAMQTFFMGSVAIYAMGMAIQTLYPTAVANSPDHHRTEFRRVLVQRLLNRGFGVGLAVSLIQCLLVPGILKSTPLQTVRQAAIVPIMIVVAFQAVNGLTSVGDGIIVGSGRFALSSAVQVAASVAYMACLHFTPKSLGLNGVFTCVGAFTLFRLAGVLAILPTVIKDAEQDPDELRHQTPTATAG
jgi:Na+-driven multidrug efflux pump